VRGFVLDADLLLEGREIRTVQAKLIRGGMVEAAEARRALELLEAKRGRVDAEQQLEGAQVAAAEAVQGARLAAKRAALESEVCIMYNAYYILHIIYYTLPIYTKHILHIIYYTLYTTHLLHIIYLYIYIHYTSTTP
jgi:hypothetical protein